MLQTFFCCVAGSSLALLWAMLVAFRPIPIINKYNPKGCIIMNKELYRAARFRSAVLMLTVGVAMIHVVHKYSNRKKF